jgi:thioredoxin-like negative regulator of GroEL
MLLPIFLAFSHSDRNYFTLDRENFASTIRQYQWVLVRFYTQHQEPCVRSFPDYNLVGRAFENNTDLLVAALDCGKYRRECLKHRAFNYPSVYLYHGSTVHRYDGGFSFESIIRWSSNLSGVTPQRVAQLVATPNSRTMKELIDNNACVLTFFHTPWCGACKRFLPRLYRIARFFKDEPSLKFAEVDADKYRSFIREYDLRIYPEIRLFVKGQKNPVTFEGKRSPAKVSEFINEHCGTRREMSDLESEAGLIDDANAVLEEFFANGRKPHYLQKLKAVPRASYYAAVMEAFLAQGEPWLVEQRATLAELKEAETTTQKEKDILAKKMNIIAFYQELSKSTQ